MLAPGPRHGLRKIRQSRASQNERAYPLCRPKRKPQARRAHSDPVCAQVLRGARAARRRRRDRPLGNRQQEEREQIGRVREGRAAAGVGGRGGHQQPFVPDAEKAEARPRNVADGAARRNGAAQPQAQRICGKGGACGRGAVARRGGARRRVPSYGLPRTGGRTKQEKKQRGKQAANLQEIRLCSSGRMCFVAVDHRNSLPHWQAAYRQAASGTLAPSHRRACVLTLSPQSAWSFFTTSTATQVPH